MKHHAQQKIATLCTLICAGVSCMGSAMAQDKNTFDSDVQVATLNTEADNTGFAVTQTAVASTVPSAYDDAQRDKMHLLFLEEETVPPLAQYDAVQPADAIAREQEPFAPEITAWTQTSSSEADYIPVIALEAESTKAPEKTILDVAQSVEKSVKQSAENAAPYTAPSATVANATIVSTTVSVTASDSAPAQPQPPLAVLESTHAADSQVAPLVLEQETKNVKDAKEQWLAAVSNDDLDQMRGGFDTGSGLLVSFGIQRAVYINGNLETTTSFNIPDVSKITSAQAAMINSAAGSVNVVQNGPGNMIQSGALSQAVGATVIQNSLNNQHIQNLTIIDTTTNSLGMLKGMNSQATLQNALSNSVTAR